jgi:hypothetical protein
LKFGGASEYLEDLVARIDAPLLHTLEITLFHQLILDTPQLTQLISRTPKLKTCDEAHVEFSNWHVSVTFPQAFFGVLKLGISCGQSDWQLSSLAQVCSSSFPQALIPIVEHLYVKSDFKFWHSRWQDDIEDNQWLRLFHPFTGVKDLYISSKFAPPIAPTLQELVGDGAVEVLPTLQNIFLEEPPSSGLAQEIIGKFVAARQLASHPIAVSRWEREEIND